MKNPQFTWFGIALLIVVFILFANSARYASAIVAFLSVVLLSMVVLNWNQIRPLFIKEGTARAEVGGGGGRGAW